MTDPKETHTNYVAYFPGTGRIKVGVTGNIRKRIKYYRQEARRHDLGHVDFTIGQRQFKGVARIVETELCRALKPWAVPKHREWFVGNYESFMAIDGLTKRFQQQMREAFGLEVAQHA